MFPVAESDLPRRIKERRLIFLTVSRVAAVVWGFAPFASTRNRVMSTNCLNARKGFYSSP
jgi:hypothetical protein